MPIYDYVCETCGHVLEVIHGIDADGPGECPLCGGPMSKAFSAPAVHFKGSGWAKKDRRSVSGPVKSRTSPDGGGTGASTGSSASVSDASTGSSSEASNGSSGPAPVSDTTGASSGATAGDGQKEG